MSDERQYLFDRPENVRRLLAMFFVICAALFVADFFVHRHASFEHGDGENQFPLELLPGFYAIYGFVACVLLVLLAKVLRKLIMRDEDYYER